MLGSYGKVLLSEDFFHDEMKPILCQWMCPGPSQELCAF